jgi:lysozyme family protein
MADFLPAYERMIHNEGGYRLHTVKGDRGGMTYAGIARKRNPQWPGWSDIDAGATPPTDMVRQFYRTNYWNKLSCDRITVQRVAENIFDFGVNAGVGVSAKLAQIAVGATPDGEIGPRTLAALNNMDKELFILRFAIAKVARYVQIITKDASQMKFIKGWLNRVIAEAK